MHILIADISWYIYKKKSNYILEFFLSLTETKQTEDIKHFQYFCSFITKKIKTVFRIEKYYNNYVEKMDQFGGHKHLWKNIFRTNHC